MRAHYSSLPIFANAASLATSFCDAADRIERLRGVKA